MLTGLMGCQPPYWASNQLFTRENLGKTFYVREAYPLRVCTTPQFDGGSRFDRCFYYTDGPFKIESVTRDASDLWASYRVILPDGRSGYITDHGPLSAEEEAERTKRVECERKAPSIIGSTREQLHKSCWGLPRQSGIAKIDGRDVDLLIYQNAYFYVRDEIVIDVQMRSNQALSKRPLKNAIRALLASLTTSPAVTL